MSPRRTAVSRSVVTLVIAWSLSGCTADTTNPVSSRAAPLSPNADGVRWSSWSAPVNLGPVVNSSANDQHPALSRNGLSLFFTSDRPGGSGGLDLWVTHRDSIGGAWSAPVNLGATVNSEGTDMAPNLTVDGHRMFFHTDRPGGCGDFDLVVMWRQRIDDDLGWQAPVNLGCTINTAYKDAGPSYTEEGPSDTPTLYFTSTRPGGFGDFDIYKSILQSDGTWGTAIHVPELSGAFRDTRTAISRTGLELILSSDVGGRIGGLGGQDLWASTRASTSDPWSTPANLGTTVNTTSFDGAPALSFDGTELYFFSNRPGGFGANDLYVTTRSRVH